jgi:Tol biopolymer transport system component
MAAPGPGSFAREHLGAPMKNFSTRAALALGLCLWLSRAGDPLGAAAPLAGVGLGDGPGLVVFSSNRSGSWQIWTVRPDGSDIRQLTRGKPDEHDVDPVFSRDGKLVLFSSTRGGTTAIWKMAADGSGLQRVCDGDQAEWSPDGKSIVFRRKERLFTRELSSGREQRISPEDWPHPSGPTWSPDGKTVAFACRWEAGNAVFLVPASGGPPTKVYDKQGACEPHWSPDGKRLVYETETHLSTIAPDGTANRPLTYFGGVQRYGRFSPDGKSVVFCQGVTERGPWELYRIPAQGGTPVKLTDAGSDMQPDWR